MKIVATSDTHDNIDPSLIPDADVFIHAGDFMMNGYSDEFKERLEWLSQLKHKTKILVRYKNSIIY